MRPPSPGTPAYSQSFCSRDAWVASRNRRGRPWTSTAAARGDAGGAAPGRLRPRARCRGGADAEELAQQPDLALVARLVVEAVQDRMAERAVARGVRRGHGGELLLRGAVDYRRETFELIV